MEGNVSGGVDAGSVDTSVDVSSDTENAIEDEGQGSEQLVNQGRGPQKKKAMPDHQQKMKELTDEYMDYMVTTKVDGKEIKKPLKELIKISQLEQASQKRLQEAAEVKKALKEREQRDQQILNLLQTDFPKFCQVMGLDPMGIATDFLAKQYDLEQMHPAERKALELEQKLKEKEEFERQIKEREEQGRQSQLKVQAQRQLDQELGEALQGSNLPKNRLFVQRAAAKMLESIERVKAGVDETPLQAKEAVAKVIEDWHSDLKETLSTMDAKAIHELLGPDTLKKIREYEVERVTGQRFQNSVDRPVDQTASEKTPKYMNEYERRSYLQKLKNQLR